MPDSGGASVHYPEIASILHVIFSLYKTLLKRFVSSKIEEGRCLKNKQDFNYQIELFGFFCDEQDI